MRKTLGIVNVSVDIGELEKRKEQKVGNQVYLSTDKSTVFNAVGFCISICV